MNLHGYEPTRVEVMACPRCGEAHDLLMTPLTYPAEVTVALATYEPMVIGRWTHWAMCPTFNEPVFHGLQVEFDDSRIDIRPARPTEAT